VPIVIVDPWKDARWDAYVASHPRATVYHTGGWIRIVCETGRYPSLSLIHEHEGRVTGVMPLAAVDSVITGRRISTLPFQTRVLCSRTMPPRRRAARALGALRCRTTAAFHEMRGFPPCAMGSETDARLRAQRAFHNFSFRSAAILKPCA
jgi:hypothetical protein